MKKYISNLKGYIKENKTLSFLISVLVIVIGYRFGSELYNKVKASIVYGNSKSDLPAAILEQAGNADNVRYSYVRGIVDAVYKNIQQFDQDEKMMVTDMNRISNQAEVIFASTYYRQSYNGSLKADLQAALVADWRGGGFLGNILNPNAEGGRFIDLNKVIQDNLS